jgi:hypothetical protein
MARLNVYMKRMKVRLSSFGYKVFQRQSEDERIGISDLIRRELGLRPSHRLQLEVKDFMNLPVARRTKKSSVPELQKQEGYSE